MNTFFNRKVLEVTNNVRSYITNKVTKSSEEMVKENTLLIINLLFEHSFEQLSTEQTLEIFNNIKTSLNKELEKREKKALDEIEAIRMFKMIKNL